MLFNWRTLRNGNCGLTGFVFRNGTYALAILMSNYLVQYPLLAESLSRALADNLVAVIPALLLISATAAAFGFWTVRRLRFQNARAQLLAHNLQHMRDENRRRLSFLNTISHDLRTPLNGITLQTHVMESAIESSDNKVVRNAVSSIRSSSGLAGKILDALLQYARIDLDSNVIASIELNSFLRQAAAPFRAAAEGKRLAFAISIPDDLAIATDRDKLHNIIINLLDNAVKFTARGTIELRARPASMNSKNPGLPIPESAEPPVPAILIEIADTGEGISPEDRERLFHEFFQAHNPARNARLGLGLGLVVAQQLAHQLGGYIECDSTPRDGSTFRLTLPLAVPLSVVMEEPSPIK